MSGKHHFLRLAAALAALLSTLVAVPARSQDQSVVLLPGKSAEQVEFAATYLLLPHGKEISGEEAFEAFTMGRFANEMKKGNDGAFHDWRNWIALPFEMAPSEDIQPTRRVIGLGGIFVEPPRVFLRCDGSPMQEILASKIGSMGPLEARYFTYLRTQSFDVAPGQSCIALINASSNDNPNIGIFREGELGSNQVVAVLLKGGLTVTLIIIGIILAIVSYLTNRYLAMLMGIVYAVAMLQNEASLFTTTFASSAQQGRAIWEALTLMVIFACYWVFLFAFRVEFKLVGRPYLSLLAGAVPLPLFWIAYVSNSTPDIIWALYLALMLFAVAMALRFDVSTRLRWIAGAIFVACVFGAILVEPYYLGRYLTDLTIEFLRDVIRLAAGLGLLLLLLIDIQQSRRERDRLTEERIAGLEHQAETDRRLLKIERQFARAREAAIRRKAQLAAASHDIRQPLVGLKSALASEAGNLSPSLQGQLHQAIDYLEHLTNEYSPRANAQASELAASDEAYSIDLILKAVESMFSAEAANAGVNLTVGTSGRMTKVPALALIRATSNLVANALRHADARNITIAVNENGGAEITVRDDGKGMSDKEIAEATLRGRKGTGSQGDGLGLAIVTELASRHDFEFELRSPEGTGTEAILRVPVAANN